MILLLSALLTFHAPMDTKDLELPTGIYEVNLYEMQTTCNESKKPDPNSQLSVFSFYTYNKATYFMGPAFMAGYVYLSEDKKYYVITNISEIPTPEFPDITAISTTQVHVKYSTKGVIMGKIGTLISTDKEVYICHQVWEFYGKALNHE